MPLIRRLSKVGFTSHRKHNYQLVNLKDLERFERGTKVNAGLLKQSRLIKNAYKPVKILGEGEISKALEVQASRFSRSAREKIERAGGKISLVNKKQDTS